MTSAPSPGEPIRPEGEERGGERSNRVRAHVVSRADWYEDAAQVNSSTRFPRYLVETDESPARRGTIASFNEHDDEVMRHALDSGDLLDLDRFRVHWLPL